MPAFIRPARAAVQRVGMLILLCCALQPVLATTLHSRIDAKLQEQQLTGAVWALVNADGSVQIEAAGTADARSGRAMRSDDRVHTGSIAKTVLATGVLRLVSQGRLALDAPLAHVLPEAAIDNPWAATSQVTVRHLLDHTAGLDDMQLWQFFSSGATPDTPLSEASGPLRVRSRPGRRFSYSNTGYALLGRVIESVTGQRYEHYLDNELLRPLGMRDSTFAFVTHEGRGGDARVAMGHFEQRAAHDAVPAYVRPAAQFTTTAADMARFAQFLMSDGRVDGRPLIAPALMRARGRPAGTEAADAGLRAGYAMGLSTRDRHGAVGLCHGGETVGYRAMLCVYPEHGRAYFLAVNADVEGADYAGIRALLTDALGVATASAAAQGAAVKPQPLGEWRGFYVPSPNRFASFAWLDTVFGFIHLRPHAQGLQLRMLQAAPLALQSMGGSLLRAPGRVMASHALVRDDAGTRVLATDSQSYVHVPGAYLGALWASVLAGALGTLHVLVAGTWRRLRRRPWRSDPLLVSWLALIALALPVALLLQQSFLAMADVTAGSLSLAGVSAAIPLTAAVSAVHAWRCRTRATHARVDALASVLMLQGFIVLAAWGLIPLRLWNL